MRQRRKDMAVFRYEAMNKQGETIKGLLSAENAKAGLERLREMGLSVLEIKEQKDSAFSAFIHNEKKVTLSELSVFSRQLSAMISAGIPITRSLYTLSRQATNATFKAALENIAKNVEDGMNITDAFGAYPKIFPDIYLAMIKTGELGGILETTLLRLSAQLQKEKQLRDNIKSATFYPRILMGFAVLMFVAMLVFMVPIFRANIPAGTEIPGVTQMIFSLSDSVRERWYYWLLSILAVVFGIASYLHSNSGKKLWDRIKFKMPIFGDLIQKTVIARFSRTLSTLLEGGIPVIQAMNSAGPTSGSILVAEAVKEAAHRIEEGRSISVPLEASGLFPPMVTQMVAVGEETGALPSLLDKVAEFYEDEVAVMTKGLSSLIEPIMLLFTGLVIGGMMISLYLPIFSSISSAG
jgi:type IV pilus assembly protein PilC